MRNEELRLTRDADGEGTLMRANAAVGLLVSLFCLAGCPTPQPGDDGGSAAGGGAGGGGGGGGPIIECGAYTGVLEGMCDLIDRCPNSGYPIAYRSHEECVQILCWAFTCRRDDLEIGNHRIYGIKQRIPNVDPAQATACGDWISSNATCALLERGFEADAGQSATPCDGVVSAPFEDDETTGGGLTAGMDCSASNGNCADGLYCDYPAFDADAGTETCRTCKVLPAPGEPCTAGNQCADGAYCAYVSGVSPNLCAAKKATGVSCDGNQGCVSGFCNQRTLLCDPLGNPGNTCTADGDCRYGGFCNRNAQCEVLRKNGGGCTRDGECQNQSCDEPTSTCGVADGVACNSGYLCASGHCDVTLKICAPKKTDGSACQNYDECASGYCDYNTQTCQPRCFSDQDCPAHQFCASFSSSSQCADKRADGQGCTDDSECVSGTCNLAEVCGPPKAIGDACSGAYQCAPNAYCHQQKCTPRVGPGGLCDSYEACAEPFLCINQRCELMSLACRPGKIGERCAYLRICDEHSVCDFGDTFLCEARRSPGQACTGNDCSPGYYCGESGNEKACTPRLPTGSVCTHHEQCVDGTWCTGAAGSPYTCKPGPEGDLCDWDHPCPSHLFCGDGYRCHAPGGQGAPCQDSQACAAGFFCKNYDRCEPLKAIGTYCSTYTEPCVEEAYCSNDVCVLDAKLGEPCSSSQYSGPQCGAGLRCVYDSSGSGYTCAMRKGTGESCYNDEECLSGGCRSGWGCLAVAACMMP